LKSLVTKYLLQTISYVLTLWANKFKTITYSKLPIKRERNYLWRKGMCSLRNRKTNLLPYFGETIWRVEEMIFKIYFVLDCLFVDLSCEAFCRSLFWGSQYKKSACWFTWAPILGRKSQVKLLYKGTILEKVTLILQFSPVIGGHLTQQFFSHFSQYRAFFVLFFYCVIPLLGCHRIKNQIKRST
jgi:hypothetical protein